jgi:hypothetical protein
MTLQMKTALCAVAVLALTACSQGSLREFYSEAGAELDEGGFGNPTMQNMLAQMCVGQAKGYIVPDPVVVLDPNSTAGHPVYYRGQVRCSGELNGKYAEVIFQEYVRSAERQATAAESGGEGGGGEGGGEGGG